ncbi:MAG: F0F1 ATP synthase subunit gamma, partial [Pirellulales bacterium]|nr:F0F1 ATP synthase subunit gamma [Pirellulales bacterium]
MANPRELDKRRKSIRNIRKITRTMELIATARFKKAMDRATAATAYTDRITQLVADLTQAGLDVTHPLLQQRDETKRATLLVLTSNRGYCGGFNGNLLRAGIARWEQLTAEVPECRIEVSGKKGIKGMKFRGIEVDQEFTHFEDKPTFDEVDVIANRYLYAYTTGQLDRLDVVYMKFHNVARQEVAVETLLPLGSLGGMERAEEKPGSQSQYEFLPSPESILEEVVPTS